MTSVAEICRRATGVAPGLARLRAEVKDAALEEMARALMARAGFLTEANAEDLERARSEGATNTVVDRLTLTDSRIASMAGGLRAVAAQPDPVGEILDGWVRPNGLEIQRVRVPLGVVAIIYENRPNVTSDAASLCLKSGNAALLRGSGSTLRSNVAIAGVLREALQKTGLPEDGVVLVDDV